MKYKTYHNNQVLIVMYDLQRNTSEQRKTANMFFKYLTKLGFRRVQYSIYYKITNNNEHTISLDRKVNQFSTIGDIKTISLSQTKFNELMDIDNNFNEFIISF